MGQGNKLSENEMSVYFIVEIKEIYDKEKYMRYVVQVPEIVENFGVKYLICGESTTVITGDWNPLRIIMIEFESMDKFNAWWNSAEYRAVAPLREKSAKTSAIIAEDV